MGNKRNTILIAEDEEFNQMFLEELFLNKPFDIVQAKDGQQAIDFFEQQGKIDLVLMDIKMPRLNGIEAMKAIKKLSPETPVIGLSAMVMELEGNSGIGIGFDAYLAKPIDRIKLFELIDAYLNK